jgi:hypothetical protein
MKDRYSRATQARWVAAVAVVALTVAAGTAFAATSHSSGTTAYPGKAVAKQLARTKAALDKYRSVDAAKAAGYAAASPCESTPVDHNQSSYGGGMGIHYVNSALMAPGSKLVATKPPIQPVRARLRRADARARPRHADPLRPACLALEEQPQRRLRALEPERHLLANRSLQRGGRAHELALLMPALPGQDISASWRTLSTWEGCRRWPGCWAWP